MNLLREDKSIKCIKFKCLLTDELFEVVGSSSTLNEISNNRDNVTKTEDKIKRLSDGVSKIFARNELKQRFTKIEIL